MGLKILPAELEKLHAHAREGYPYEVVGILAGARATLQVSRVLSLQNERADSARNRYAVSALVLMRAEQALEAEGLEVVGYYHSHPDHPAQYSEFDRDHALPNMSYLIVSVVQGQIADTLVWQLTEDRSAMAAQPLEST